MSLTIIQVMSLISTSKETNQLRLRSLGGRSSLSLGCSVSQWLRRSDADAPADADAGEEMQKQNEDMREEMQIQNEDM